MPRQGETLLTPALFKAIQLLAGHLGIICGTELHTYILIILLCTIVCKVCSVEQSILVQHLSLTLEEDVIISII